VLSTIIDAGRHELSSRAKKLSHLANLTGPASEVRTSKGPITADLVANTASIWFVGPRRDLKADDVRILGAFIQKRGACLIFSDSLPPLFGQFVKKFDVSIAGAVIAPTYVRYVGPHQVTVQQGIVNRAVAQFAQR
jgi:hypothetical protein